MARKRATKAAVKVTGGAKRQTPAMYPTPAPLKLATPQKVVAIDPKTIAIEGSVSPEEFAAIAEMLETERRRMDLTGRLAEYKRKLVNAMAPHWGERPKHISPAKWGNLKQRVNEMTELPETAPAEAHHILAALKTFFSLVDELADANNNPQPAARAICWAIDLGILLQRGQSQIEHGETVDRGKRNAKSTADANDAKARQASGRREQAKAEFLRRMATVKIPRMKTATLKNMSVVMATDGVTPKWGSLTTLKRWSCDWKGITD